MDGQLIIGIIIVAVILWIFANMDTGTSKVEKEIERKEKEIRKRIAEEEHKTKVSILMKLKMNHLRTICAAEGLECPKTRRKEDLANYLAEHLDLENVKNWAWRYKTASKDEIKAFREVEKTLWNEFEEFRAEKLKELEPVKSESLSENSENYETKIDESPEVSGDFEETNTFNEPDILDLLEDFQPETVRDEEDLEKQLYQFLRARLGSSVARQYSVGDQKIDIAIDGRVGIEIKIAENRSRLQRLVGQVLDYVEYFDEVIAVILDVGANVDIDRYINKLRQLGADVVVLEGDIQRKGHSREIIIKDARRKIIIR